MYFQKIIETYLCCKSQAHLEMFLEFEGGAMAIAIVLGRKFRTNNIPGRHSGQSGQIPLIVILLILNKYLRKTI